MKIPDLAELALRNLRESLLRNSLTTIGISVGVASLVAMLSLGIGLQQMASRRLVKSGLFDTVVVTSRREMRGMGREEERNGPTAGESRVLDEAARSDIERMPNVAEAYPDIRFPSELRFEDKSHMTMISALPESAKANDAFEGMQGTFFTSTPRRKPFCRSHLPRNFWARRRPWERRNRAYRSWRNPFWEKNSRCSTRSGRQLPRHPYERKLLLMRTK